MKLPSSECAICGKPKGKSFNHDKCSKQLQKMFKDEKRVAVKKHGTYKFDQVATWVLRTTA